MKKKSISITVIITMLLSLFTPFGEITYAASNDFSFNWERDKTIKSIIDIANRIETENELVLSWSYNKIIGGSDTYVGDYLLKYNLSDKEQIELAVNNTNDTMAQVKYRVRNLESGAYKESSLKAYDANGQNRVYWKYQKGEQNDGKGQWVNENNTNEVWKNSTTNANETDLENYKFKPTGLSVEMINNGKDIGPNITINKGSIATFVYDNKLVVLKLDESGQNILLGIDNIERGKIYNFNISCVKGNQKYETDMDIFKLVEFKTDPVGEYKIDKTQAGNETSHPGQDPVGMKVRVAIPYIWDEKSSSYVNDIVYKYPDGIKAVINLKSSKTGEAIQIDIPNIYEPGNCTLNVVDPTKPDSKSNIELDGKPTITTEKGKNYYTLFLKNMEASTLYNTANISVDVVNNTGETKLKANTCNLAAGENAYTYLWYDTETKNTGERVLKIKPYNVSGTYSIYQATTDIALEGEGALIARKDWKVTDTGQIEIPVSNDIRYQYIVKFTYELGDIRSQILIDISDTSKYLITPQLKVKDYEIITENKADKISQKLRMTLSWSGGKKETFDALVADGKSVVYSFVKTPFSPMEGKYAKFFALEVKNSGGDNYSFTKVADKETNNEWSTATLIEAKSINQISNADETNQVISVNFETTLEFELFDETDMGSRDEPSSIFYYPSVYYIKMSGLYTNSLGVETETPYCNPVNITLDESSKTVLPPPQDVILKDPTTYSFELNWATVTEAVYSDYIKANDYDLQPENGVAVNIFLTQQNVLNEADATKQAAYFDYQNGANTNIVSIDYAKLVVEGDEDYITLDMSSLIDSIRNNKMIRIFNLPQILSKKEQQSLQIVYIKGLDKNTVYYVALQTVLNVINKSDKEEKIVMSDKVSKISTITTKKEDPLNPPQPEEIPPEAPKDFKQDDSVEQLPTKITLSWTDVKDPQSINGVNVKKEYELIRVNRRLDDSLLSKRNSFDDFWSKDLSSSELQKVAWQTISSKVHPDNLLIYNGTDFISNTTDTSQKYSYDYANSPKLQFVDKTIMPNKIYYYYIRTVRMKEENGTYKESAWSSWTPLSITTATIKAPTELKLERNDTYFTYDPEKEIIISFFAPIPVGTSFADIASLYPLEYSIMKEDGKEEIHTMEVTNSSLFKSGNEKKEGYQHYVYKITGLEAGKGYSVKVRMKSRVNPITESTPIYDVSLYSNSVEFRTDMNQEDYDTEEGIKKWLKKFDDDLMALSAKSYWLTDSTNTTYEAIYRTKTFNAELQKATSGAYNFEAENQRKQTYYIPAGTINLSDSSNVGYKAVKDAMDILIRPGSFDSSTSEAIQSAITKIKDGDSKDYFIEIILEWNSTNESINNSSPLSEVVQISINVVGSKETEKELDAKFVQFFKDATDASENSKAKVRNQLKKDLKKAIKDGDSAEEIFKMVEDAVQEAYKDIIDDIDKAFNKSTKGSSSVTSLAENILITSTVNSQSSVSGYRKNNGIWETIPTKDYGNKKGFETNLLGIFIFSGRVINIPDISGIPNSTYVKEIIAKYGLDDYLGKDVIDSKRKITKYEVTGCIAKMAGAEASQNPIAYLKSKGINVTSAKIYDNISNQEAIYLIMALYETKTGTKVSTVRITNYNTLENIKDANDSYKKSLQVSAQLGICTDTSIAPKDTISIKDFLKYLGNMSQKINL